MSNTEHVRKAALNMIERYGDDALRQVDLRIEELRERGSDSARKLWVEIRQTVEALTRDPTNGQTH